MRLGTTLHRIARLTCTSDSCDRILEPALSDLQHEWSSSHRWRALLRNYAAFWQSWGVCVLQDAIALQSRSFTCAAFTGFALTVVGMALIELVLMDTSFAIRRLIVTSVHGSRVVFAAMDDTATLRYGIPLAMGPTLFYATWQAKRVGLAASVTTAVLGMLIVVLSSGWIAPSLIRHKGIRQHEDAARWAAHAPSSSVRGHYVAPVDFSFFPQAKSWPELILSAAEPPRHQFPLMPQYVAPGEEDRPAYDRQEIIERLLLVLLALGSAVVGGTLGWFAKQLVVGKALDDGEAPVNV